MLVWPFILAAVATAISFAVTTSPDFIDEVAWVAQHVQGHIADRPCPVLHLSLLRGAECAGAGAVPRWVACLPALAFSAMQKVFEIYLASSAILKSVYGAFAAFPVFLVWLH